MADFACKSRVLIKDGRWQVPVCERPENWKEILEEPEIASTTNAQLLATAVAAMEDQAVTQESRVVQNQTVPVTCSVTWCNRTVENMKFRSEDEECTIGLCKIHSEMSSMFCCDEKSPDWIAKQFGCLPSEVLEAIRLEMTGLWLEHRPDTVSP